MVTRGRRLLPSRRMLSEGVLRVSVRARPFVGVAVLLVSVVRGATTGGTGVGVGLAAATSLVCVCVRCVAAVLVLPPLGATGCAGRVPRAAASCRAVCSSVS